MKIRYLWRSPTTYPSLRLRVLTPGKYLGGAGLGHDLDIIRDPEPCDVLVMFKHHPDNPTVAREWSQEIPVVFDLCDDHFDNQAGPTYRSTIKNCTHVTCTTRHIQDRIWQQTGVRAHLVTDPYEWPEEAPKRPTEKLLWHGTGGNLQPLIDILPSLEGYDVLALCDNTSHPLVTEWSHEGLAEGFREAGICIIPTKQDNHGQAKGPNRMVDAIRQGLYCVAGPLRSYEPYGMWQGNIADGVRWALDNPRAAQRAVKKAQKLIRELHDPEKIAKQWETAFERAITRHNTI